MLSLDIGGKVPEPAEDDTESRDDEEDGQERDEEREVTERPPPDLQEGGELPSSPGTDVGDLPLEQNISRDHQRTLTFSGEPDMTGR